MVYLIVVNPWAPHGDLRGDTHGDTHGDTRRDTVDDRENTGKTRKTAVMTGPDPYHGAGTTLRRVPITPPSGYPTHQCPCTRCLHGRVHVSEGP